jgi:two-component system, OmpR family, phosphate regulon response regulator PhoB
MKKPLLLIIEDESAIRDMLRFALSAEFELLEAENASVAERQIAKRIPALILLDWMLPGMSGIDFAKQLKKKTQTRDIPVIMLTAKAEEENKIKGLEIGADDYVVKPFSPRELIARIKTVLRRGPLITTDGIIQVNDLLLNVNTHQLSIHNLPIELAPVEYKLLHFFMTHADRVYSRDQLLDHVWGGENYIDERTVDVQIRRLRKQLKPHGYDAYIKTVHGVGYQFMSKLT